jgi:hypothetical protein
VRYAINPVRFAIRSKPECMKLAQVDSLIDRVLGNKRNIKEQRFRCKYQKGAERLP